MNKGEEIIKDLKELEERMMMLGQELDETDEAEIEIEAEHRKMYNELLNSDLVANQPNQPARNAMMEDYLMNHDQYRPIHEKYLLIKNKGRRLYRQYKFLEEVVRNRRAELNFRTYSNASSE